MRALLLGSVLGAALLSPVVASAMTAYADTTIRIQAGPGSNYPTLETLDKDTRLWVHGCQQAGEWCDISHGRQRGWVAKDKLAFSGDKDALGNVPVATFNLDSYWNENYRREAFYADRGQWRDSSRQVAQDGTDR